MKYSAWRSFTLGFFSIAICMGIFVWITYRNMQDTMREGKSVNTALQSLKALETILSNLETIEASHRGYIITGDKRELVSYFKSVQNIREDSVTIASLIGQNNSRENELGEIQRMIHEKILFTDKLIAAKDSGGFKSVISMIENGNGSNIAVDIRHLINTIENQDRVVLRQSNLMRLEKAKYTTTLYFVLSSIFFLLFAVAYFIIKKNLKRHQIYQVELAYLSTLVKQTSETIFSTDRGFIVKSWNRAAEKMYGHTTAEAVGKRLNTLFTVHLNSEQYPALLADLHKNGEHKSEFEVSLKTGQSIFIQASITVLKNESDEITGYVAVHKDISERVKLEDQLRRLNEDLEEKVNIKSAELTHIFERITDAFIALDRNWCFTYVNKRAGEILNQDSLTIISKNIEEVFSNEKQNNVFWFCQKAFEEQKYCYLEEYSAILCKWIEYNIYPSPQGLSVFFRDITEKKESEQELKASEEKYRALIELSSDAIFINQAGFIKYANPAALKLFGTEVLDQVTGKSTLDFFPSEYHDSFIKRMDDLTMKGIVPPLIEEKIIQLDGNLVDVELVANAFTYLGEKAIQVVLRNLTERKELERKLRDSDRIFNNSVDLLCIAGADGFFKVLNPAWTRTLGWSMEEILSKPWIEFVHDEDKKEALSPWESKCVDRMQHLENRFLCKDGTYRWISWNTFVYPEENEIFGVGRDITAARISEEELFRSNQLFQNLTKISPVGIFRTNINGDFLYVNEHWCAIAGMSNEEALGKAWLNAIHPEDIASVNEKWYGTDFEKATFNLEYRFINPDGVVTWVMGRAKTEHNNSGEVIGYVGCITDITALKVAGQLVKNSEEGLCKAQHYAHVGSWNYNIQKKIFNWSDEMYSIFGVDQKSFLPQPGAFFSMLTKREDKKRVQDAVMSVLKGEVMEAMEFEINRPDGTKLTISAEIGESTFDDTGKGIEISGIIQDITQRKQSELEIRKATRLYEFISQVNQLMLRAKSRDTTFAEVCRIAVEYGKFGMAWVALIDEQEQVLKAAAWAGMGCDYFEEAYPVSIADLHKAKSLVLRAIQEGNCFYCNDIENDPSVVFGREKQLKRGFLSTVSLPIWVEGKVLGAFNIYTTEAFFFIPSEIKLLEEVTSNIGLALEIIEAEKRRKMAEEGLRKLSTAVEQSSASIVITDLEGRIEYVNKAFTKTSGYSLEESLNQNPRILRSEVTDPATYNQLWANLTSALEWNGVFCNKKKNGELYWETATISPILNEEGKIINYVAVKEDITDKIKAEEQLLREKELSDSIINSLPGIFYLYDEEGNFIRWNKNFATVSGYSAAEIITMHPADFYADKQMIRQRIASVLNGENNGGAEVVLLTKTRKRIPYYFNSLPIVYEGKRCIIGTGADITDRKEAEEENRKLAMIASHTINSVIMVDTNARIQWVNKGFERISKYRYEEVVGRNPNDFLHGPATDPHTVHLIKNCIAKREALKVEALNYNKAGDKYWIDLEVFPIQDENNVFKGFMAIQQDITEKKMAEKELLILNESLHKRATELVASNNELERFAYVASHDLQEPLRMVSSFMQLLKANYQNQLDEKALQYIGFAVDGTKRMKQLILDLLEYSRVGTNKDLFVKTDMNVVLQKVKEVFVKHGVENLPEIVFGAMPAINANESQMLQLLQNLIGNGIKYNSSLKAKIKVGCEDKGDCFLFSISDNGIGISKDYFDRIFVLFQRLHLKEEYSGTGIGLTICKKIVERHGGTIWVESEPGQGSTFYFTIKKEL